VQRPTRYAILRIYNLETVRFLAAGLVFFSHGGAPVAPVSGRGGIAEVLYSSLWNGEGAVMIFFVISGFCIHLPQTKSHRLGLTS
jgi:peptidoglycan/LPS O-acetylase OafA/YrhL